MSLRVMHRAPRVFIWLLLAFPGLALGRGVTPYLPLNLEPEIESQIERVLILGDKPVMSRPVPAAAVLDALPAACKIDHALCTRVKRYLARYTHNWGVTHASVEGAVTTGAGADTAAPNRYGMDENSHWDASAQAYLQTSDYLLVDLGAVSYEGRTNFSGSMMSLGWDFAQLDIGFRPHWFSPLSDSSMLMSSEAPTMPSVTLSNYESFTRLGLHYELFVARMSNSNRIVFGNGLTSGNPRLAGIHLDAEPATGWSLGVSRLLQYGGGALGGNSLHTVFNAFFNPSAGQTSVVSRQIGNQQGSFTSSLLFPGPVPFAVYFEYAGEDTSRGKNYLLGNSALSAGIHFPRIWRHFDLTLETSEWQNLWYVHSVYLDGLTNDGRVVGNWGADQRLFGDGVGAQSHSISLGWDPPFGGLVQLRYRTLQNQTYGQANYQRFQYLSLGYSRPWSGVVIGGEVDAGRDVFGGNFMRLAGFLRYDPGPRDFGAALAEALEGEDERGQKQGELFVEAGGNTNRTNFDLTTAATRFGGPRKYGYHFGAGARRFVADHSDLGARVEVDSVDGHSLLGVRAVDYRYRFNSPLALGFYLGAARYALATPAYGIYYGLGAQLRNILSGWDLNADLKYANSVARDHLLPGDPPNIGGRTDSFYNITIATVSISRHF